MKAVKQWLMNVVMTVLLVGTVRAGIADTLVVAARPAGGDDMSDIGRTDRAILRKIEEARELISRVKEGARYIESLTDESLTDLPLGIKTNIGNITYTLVISAMRLLPERAEIDLLLEIDLPDQQQDPVFGANNVAFSRRAAFLSDTQLSILSDYSIDLRDQKARIVFSAATAAGRGTYVTVDCQGFKSLQVEGYAIFSRDWLLPVGTEISATGNTGIDSRVHAGFSLEARSWDFIMQLQQVSPFTVVGIEDVNWTLEGITLDLSEQENAPEFRFPDNYESPWGEGQQVSPLWRGLYAKAVRVGMPARFSQQPISGLQVQATDIIIDDQGFTGKVTATNLLKLEEGELGSWAFAIDSLQIDIMAMQLREARIGGLVHLPLLSGEDAGTAIARDECIAYKALLQAGGHYAFSLYVEDSYQAAVWKARINLHPNSSIRIDHGSGGSLQAQAILHGQLSVRDETRRSAAFEASGIAFENLRLGTVAPYLQSGHWGVPGQVDAHLGNFGLHFNTIRLHSAGDGREAYLSFDVRISLSEGMQAISAAGRLSIQGQLVSTGIHARWEYGAMEVERIQIRASCSAWGLEGGMDFYEDDEVYGCGFSGSVSVWFAGLRPASTGGGFSAIGQFGSKSEVGESSYRYFFVDVLASWANGLPIGTLRLLELGGGVAQRVRVEGSEIEGLRYIPDRQAGLRISARVAVASPGGSRAFSVRGIFEVAIAATGGIDSIRISGEAAMLGADRPGGEQDGGAGVLVWIEMLYDDQGEERGFSASAEVFFNLAAGRFVGGRLHPSGREHYAGGLEMMFGGGHWYVYVGTPTVPLGVEAVFGEGARPMLAAYIDIGTDVPPMPPVPDYVDAGLSGTGGRIDGLIGGGAGFVFGASLNMNTEKKRKAPFYYQLGVGLGFDVMLQNYGTAVCANRSNEPIGINGWYASGQAWAYLQGAIGITLNLPFAQGDYDIVHASLAAVLQIKGPNPFWAAANLRGMYRLLGGAAKGSFNIRVELGQTCLLAEEDSDPMASLQLIETVTPTDGLSDVPVNQKIRATTSLPFNLPQKIQEQTYKLILIQALVQKQPTGEIIEADIYHAEDTILMIPFAHLDGMSLYQLSLQVALLRRNEQGLFIDTANIEHQIVQFTTTASLEHIPLENINYAWPIPGQHSFYPAESTEAYIKLIQAQPMVVNGSLFVSLTSASGENHQQPAQISEDGRRLSFVIPPLALQTGYRLDLIRLNNDPLSGGRTFPGPGQSPQSTILTYYFRTSQFNRFSQKVASVPAINVNRFGQGLFSCSGELFDAWELMTSNFTTTPVGMTTSLPDHPWFNALGLSSLLYTSLPIPGLIENTWRDAAAGFPPSKAVHIAGKSCPPYNQQQFIQAVPPCSGQDTLRFQVPLFIQMDHDGYKQQALNSIEYWVEQEWIYIQNGDMNPEDLGHYDIDQDGQLTVTDLRRAIKEVCSLPAACQTEYGGIRCPQFSGTIPCPLPESIGQLAASQLNVLSSCRGKSFSLLVEFTLPGMNITSTVANLQVTINQ
jgi:hypothetical protein